MIVSQQTDFLQTAIMPNKTNISQYFASFCVLFGVVLFSSLIYWRFVGEKNPTQTFYACFENVGDLMKGHPVKINGVVVGKVLDIRLNPENFDVKVHFSVEKTFPLRSETEVSIEQNLLMGDPSLNLFPSLSGEILKPESVLEYTVPPISAMDLIQRFLFKSNDSSGKKDAKTKDLEK